MARPKKLKEGRGDAEFETEDGNTKVKKGKNPKLFPDAPAYVSFSTGVTINIGNYESKRLDIGLTRPCKDTKSAINKTFKEVIKEVEDKIEKKEKEIRESLNAENISDKVGLSFIDEE